MDDSRIAVLTSGVADQIAAGEVVERPSSVVKELVENAIDAGARRIEISLDEAGRRRICVQDDGRGIHPEDLELALRRHATSKIRRAEQLLDVSTLGFRGEALASIAAVARVTLRSRVAAASVGHELVSVLGQVPESGPRGMAHGTRIEVEHLFAAIPARRKFLRSEATEVGHCCDAVIRAALVHPEVRFVLNHGGRELLNFSETEATGRIAQVLERRAVGPFFEVSGEHEGVRVRAWFAPPDQGTRQRSGIFIVVRRRVVSERSLAQILRAVHGERLPAGCHPVACLFVEPAKGSVDVNVHPQKSEVRFSAPQEVYAAVRELLGHGMKAAPWLTISEGPPGRESFVETPGSTDRFGAGASAGAVVAGARGALESWSRSTGEVAREPTATSRAYRLSTRALGRDYGGEKRGIERRVALLGGVSGLEKPTNLSRDRIDDAEPLSLGETPSRAEDGATHAAVTTGPALLACLPGPVALFMDEAQLLAVDLRRLRAYLLQRRLERDLREVGSKGQIPSQVLLNPIVVRREPSELSTLLRGRDALAGLGVLIEEFGEGALVVRALPAQLRNCVEDADVCDLLVRVVPWLRLRERVPEGERDAGESTARDRALVAMSRTAGREPAPRLARRWINELVEEGVNLESVPGIRRWSASELTI